MSPTTVSEVLADAAASMVSPDRDVTGALSTLLAGVAEVVPADAAAVLVETEGGHLELLAATSHRVADLEMYHVQADEGPCVDSIRGDEEVSETGTERILARWPATGTAMVRSGYAGVHATPLRWRGTCFGALTVFYVRDDLPGPTGAECRALADAATMLIVSTHLGDGDLRASLHAALRGRAVVEQAKGVLAQVGSLDMASAYDELVRLTAEDGGSLGEMARRVVRAAALGTLGGSYAPG